MKNTFWITTALFFTAFIAIVLTYYPKLIIMSGYAAKMVCSCTFIGGYSEEVIKNQDLDFAPINLTSIKIDHNERTVTASVFGFNAKTAVFREGVGCALVTNISTKEAYKPDFKLHNNQHDSLLNWFDDKTLPTNPQLASAINNAFDENDPDDPEKNTRAVIVIHKGRLIGEQYWQRLRNV